ncbi:MAG: succinylglutamate desuccinylase/aspartoacylase family protein [Ignavibacteriaceae bacterium]
MPDLILINGVAISKGENKEVNLNIAKLPTHTMIDLPIHVYRAKKNGPTLLITAGLHGDEINGIEVIRRMIFDKSIFPFAGTVIAIPVVNIYGFIHTSRKFPDGKDLNRSFPGSKNGSLASKIAYVLINEIVPHIDCGVDFHTGGASKMNHPHIRCDYNYKKYLELAKAFSPQFIVNSKAPDHSFRQAAFKMGKFILTFEGGESLRFDEHSISEGINGILRLMKFLGMKKEKGKANKTKLLNGSWWIRAKHSGLFRSEIKIGEKIKQNQTLGYITDPFGESQYEIKARAAGYIIGLNNLCVVNNGDAIIHIGGE